MSAAREGGASALNELRPSAPREAGAGRGGERARRGAWGAVRPLALPLVCYLVMTVLLPALNGAYSEPGFLGHVLWIAVAVAATSGVWATLLILLSGR